MEEEKPCFILGDEADVMETGASLPFAKARRNLLLGGSRNSTTTEEGYRNLTKQLSEAFDAMLKSNHTNKRGITASVGCSHLQETAGSL